MEKNYQFHGFLSH